MSTLMCEAEFSLWCTCGESLIYEIEDDEVAGEYYITVKPCKCKDKTRKLEEKIKLLEKKLLKLKRRGVIP